MRGLLRTSAFTGLLTTALLLGGSLSAEAGHGQQCDYGQALCGRLGPYCGLGMGYYPRGPIAPLHGGYVSPGFDGLGLMQVQPGTVGYAGQIVPYAVGGDESKYYRSILPADYGVQLIGVEYVALICRVPNLGGRKDCHGGGVACPRLRGHVHASMMNDRWPRQSLRAPEGRQSLTARWVAGTTVARVLLFGPRSSSERNRKAA